MTHHEKNDHDFRSRFAELRRMDESTAPAFAIVLGASRKAKMKQSVRVARGSALLLGACATAALITTILLKSDDRDEFTAQGIAEWRPRSDALLAAARQTLLADIPSLNASVLDPILR